MPLGPVSPTRSGESVAPHRQGVAPNISATEASALVGKWRARTSAEAARSQAFAEQHQDSAAAWARAAAAHRLSGDLDSAKLCAAKAFSLSVAAARAGNLPRAVAALSTQILIQLDGIETILTALEDLPVESAPALHAEIAAQRGDFSRALSILESPQGDDENSSFHGYVLLQLGKPERALRQFRRAVAINDQDSIALINAAEACRQLGALKKAVGYARRAVRLTPGRRDFGIKLIELLIDADQWEEVRNVIRALRASGVQDSADLLTKEASIASQDGKHDRALALMRRALQCDDEERSDVFVAEIRANIAHLELLLGRRTRIAAIAEYKRLLADHPTSRPILHLLTAQLERSRDAEVLAPFVGSGTAPFSVRVQHAFLGCDFEEALRLSDLWLKAEPSNWNAVLTHMGFLGHVRDDWGAAATLAKKALRRAPSNPFIANQSAFCLALARESQLARRALSMTDEWDYRLEATSGLVAIAAGDVSGGLRLYRHASEMVASAPDAAEALPLMVQYQALGLRVLGLLGASEVPQDLRAGLLPEVELPASWAQIPAFVMLQQAALRNGWPWPLSVE
ncbi:tetratricopeptide repeat protein [Kineosporia sp. A_224]|uniref:tetratricopeptide repeat protein n=1 Tax=Kineosporia sp. A_224 TaxID=1962180 RepID=UPI0013043E40|nr:tetratricopeptide repeat protein [Kineosporia sp. A_224]